MLSLDFFCLADLLSPWLSATYRGARRGATLRTDVPGRCLQSRGKASPTQPRSVSEPVLRGCLSLPRSQRNPSDCAPEGAMAGAPGRWPSRVSHAPRFLSPTPAAPTDHQVRLGVSLTAPSESN